VRPESCNIRTTVNLRDLIETPYQVNRLAADMLTTVALFADRPVPGTALMQACLPGLLKYVSDSGGSLRDAAKILKHPAHLVAALQASAWEIDDGVLDSLKHPESGPLLRQWSATVAALSDSPTISEELERRTAQSVSEDQEEEQEDD
jgi:hypothetical protein